MRHPPVQEPIPNTNIKVDPVAAGYTRMMNNCYAGYVVNQDMNPNMDQNRPGLLRVLTQ